MIRWLLRLYPRPWRERYGDEIEDLVSGGLSPGAAVDLIAGALREHVRSATRRSAGGPRMADGDPGRRSTLRAVAGFLILAPTLLFMSFSVLLYNLGVPAEPIRRIVEAAVSIAPVSVGIAVLPFAALAIAAAPLLHLTVERDGARHGVIARLGVRPLRQHLANVIVVGLALAVIAAMVAYLVTENIL